MSDHLNVLLWCIVYCTLFHFCGYNTPIIPYPSAASKSLDELRTMYFKFKDSVFCKRGGVVPQGETEVLEKLLKETFGETETLGSRLYPR